MTKNLISPHHIIGFLAYGLMIVTAVSFQTTVWFSFFGYFPSPCFWAPLFVYLMMNREFPKNFLWLMFFFIAFTALTTAIPLALFLTFSTMWGLIRFVQKRISTLGMFDFILFSVGCVFLFPLIYFIFSLFSESSATLQVLDLFITLFLSIPTIPVTLIICKKIDTLFDPMNNSDNLVLDI